MTNDFIPVIHKLAKSEYPNGITIIPLSDVHYGSAEFDEVMWHNTIKRIQDDRECFCVLVGDMIDNGLKNSVTNIYEATAMPHEQKEWLYSELAPIKAKVLGGVGGNHERRSGKEFDSDPLFDVLARLGIENVYRPNICFMQVVFFYKGTDGGKPKERQTCEYTFAITHGSGGGQYIGSSANRVQNFGMAIEGVDCLITGHTHKPMTFPVAKLAFVNGMVHRKQFVVAVSSSFLNYGGYPVQKMMVPAAKTTTEIILANNEKKPGIRVLQ